MELDLLPNDVIEKIRKIYFTTHVLPTIKIWYPVYGCTPRECQRDCFASRVVYWASIYLYCFHPYFSIDEHKTFREYMRTNKYCWANTITIEIDSHSADIRNDMTSIKLALQQRFTCIEVCGKSIRFHLKHEIQDWVSLVLRQLDVDESRFEWKPLILRIDFQRGMAYFEDPSNGKISHRVYLDNEYDDYPRVIDPIPWFVYIP